MLIPSELFLKGFRAIVGWFDVRTEAPIMRRRVNKGSEQYFAYEERHRGATELDEILDPEGADSDDDDPNSPRD